MLRKTFFVILFSIVAIGFVRAEREGPETAAPWYEAALNSLSSYDEAERVKAYEEIALWRDRLVAQLIKIVTEEPLDGSGSNPDDPPRFSESGEYAVKLLGKLRAVEAVPVQIDRIKVFGSGGKRRELSLFGPWPAMGALTKIGKPAVAAILERRDSETDERKLNLYKWIIRDVERIRVLREDPVPSLDKDWYPKYEYEDIASRFKEDKPLPEIERLKVVAEVDSDRIDLRNPRWRELMGERQKALETARAARKKAYEDLSAQIDDIVAGLREIIRESRWAHPPPDCLTRTFGLIGTFRPDDNMLIETVLANIWFEDPRITDTNDLSTYPAVKSLIEIGKPLVRVILHRTREECDGETLGIFCEVLRRVEGDRGAVKLIKLILTDIGRGYFSTSNENLRSIGRFIRSTSEYTFGSEKASAPVMSVVSGLVRSGRDAKPIAGVTFEIRNLSHEGGVSEEFVTDEEGRFELRRPIGRYYLSMPEAEREKYYRWEADPFTLSAGSPVEFDIFLFPRFVKGTYVGGRVINAVTGEPVVGAKITFDDDLGPIYVESGAEGLYEIEFPERTGCPVGVSAEGYFDDDAKRPPTWEDRLTLLDFRLTPKAEVSGRVTDYRSGEPIAGIKVTFKCCYSAKSTGAESDADGLYSMAIPRGKVRIRFRDRDDEYMWADWRPGLTDRVLDIDETAYKYDIRLIRKNFTIRGQVLVDGEGGKPEGLHVRAVALFPFGERGGKYYPPGRLVPKHVGSCYKFDSEGNFEIENPPPCDGALLVTAPGLHPAASRRISIGLGGRAEGVAIPMRSPAAEATLSGRIVFADSGEPVRSSPSAEKGRCIIFNPVVFVDGEYWFMPEHNGHVDGRKYAYCDPEGAFTAKLPAGDWLVECQPVHASDYRKGPHAGSYELVRLGPGQSQDIELKVTVMPNWRTGGKAVYFRVGVADLDSAVEIGEEPVCVQVAWNGQILRSWEEEGARLRWRDIDLGWGEYEIYAVSENGMFASKRVPVALEPTDAEIFGEAPRTEITLKLERVR